MKLLCKWIQLIHRFRVSCNQIVFTQSTNQRHPIETQLLVSLALPLSLSSSVRLAAASVCPLSMDKTVIRFNHCDKDIFCCFVPDQCPECRVSFSGKRLEEAPVSIPNPFSNGHKVPCAFLVAPTEENVLRDFDGHSDLHTGITNTKGIVYNYTKTGVHRDHQGWERCICVPMVQPDMFNLISQWDQYLEKFSSAQMWDPLWQSFHEETHNCFSYTLMFINCVLAAQSKRALSKDEFTHTFVLPRIRRATKYMMLYREISQNHFYIVNSPRRNSPEAPNDEDQNKYLSS